jgi:hypothetical protein
MGLQGDIFKSSEDGGLTTFDGAFPSIESLEVVIDETGEGTEGLGLRCLTRRSVREFINCSNPRCYGKGLDLGGLLRSMLHTQQLAHTLETPCGSREESGVPCPNIFHVRLQVIYRESF